MVLHLIEENESVVETTLGDLINAIQEAAIEAHIDESELEHYTEMVLHDMLSKYAA